MFRPILLVGAFIAGGWLSLRSPVVAGWVMAAAEKIKIALSYAKEMVS